MTGQLLSLDDLDALLADDTEASPNPVKAQGDNYLLRWVSYSLEELLRLGPLDDCTEAERHLLQRLGELYDSLTDE